MRVISDFHIHGPYAMACSKQTTIKKLADNAKIKGLNVLGTGDALHPKWFQNITSELEEDSNGILWTRETNPFPFIWQTELSLMYTQDGKGRRIHHVILMPNKDVVIQVRDALLKRGRLDYDGRPIFGFSSIELIDMLRSISEDIEVIPAHAWTSWMSIFGSKSGFNSVEECFKEKSKYIHAIETGLSSNPYMNRRVSSLDKYNLVSFSDPHSYHTHRLGREATILDIKNLTYKNILNAIRTGEGLAGTVEVNPAYGKYHIDGHRACGVVLQPSESKKLNGICPRCKQPLTIGVAYRVEELADRKEPINVPYYTEVIPLAEVIALVLKKGVTTKTVLKEYSTIISKFDNEFNILMNVKLDDLKLVTHEKIAEAIIKIREKNVKYKEGYDGVYGYPILNEEEKTEELKKPEFMAEFQKGLNEFSH